MLHAPAAPDLNVAVDGQIRVTMGGASLSPTDAETLGIRLVALAGFAKTCGPRSGSIPTWADTTTGIRSILTTLASRLVCKTISGPDGSVYLERYYLADSKEHGRVYLHHFLRGDMDRELHGHPFTSDSYVLLGSLREERRGEMRPDGTYPIVVIERHAGDTYQIGADTWHRLDLITPEAWTLFVTGPKIQTWAFWSRDTGDYTPWRKFIGLRDDPNFTMPTADEAHYCLAVAEQLPEGDPGRDRLRAQAANLMRGEST